MKNPTSQRPPLAIWFCSFVFIRLYPPRAEAADDQDHGERDQEQYEGHEEQCVAPDRAERRIAHLDDDVTRQRCGRREQRCDDLRRVADEHLHGHRLADCARHREHDSRQDARRCGRHDDVDHRLPPRCAEREARLLQRLRHGIERIRADGEDRRHDHDGEHERSREHAEARRRAERIAQVRHEQHQADVAVDDRRDGDVEVRRRTHDVLEPARCDLREEDGAEQAERRADEHGEDCRHQRADDE